MDTKTDGHQHFHLGAAASCPTLFVDACFAVHIESTKLVLSTLTTLIVYLLINALEVSWCLETTYVCFSRIRWPNNCHWLINLGKEMIHVSWEMCHTRSSNSLTGHECKNFPRKICIIQVLPKTPSDLFWERPEPEAMTAVNTFYWCSMHNENLQIDLVSFARAITL